MRNRRLVVFAGAGVSTEQNELFPSTLKEDIADELRIAADSVTFQELMSRYCEQPDGRQRLLQAIRGRIDYARGFPEIYGDLTAFHRALAPIWQISSIVTTNWDDFFERECSALPLVSPADFSFWSIPGRKVFKLHGSISNPASIVATTQDYEECADRLRTGLLGSSLRHMLATQSFVFVGYSLTDPDFVQIHSALAKEMGGLQPHSYVVTLDKEAAPRFEEMGLTPIVTDAAYFAELLHDHLVELGENLPRAQVGSLGILLDEFIERHITLLDNVSPVRHPEVVHCASYQDGVIHALKRILALANDGQYYCPWHVGTVVHPYKKLRRDKLKRGGYYDVAYIDGYINGHIMLAASPGARRGAPRYYVFGCSEDLRSERAYRHAARDAKQLHKAAYRQAERMVREKLDGGTHLVPQHRPFL